MTGNKFEIITQVLRTVTGIKTTKVGKFQTFVSFPLYFLSPSFSFLPPFYPFTLLSLSFLFAFPSSSIPPLSFISPSLSISNQVPFSFAPLTLPSFLFPLPYLFPSWKITPLSFPSSSFSLPPFLLFPFPPVPIPSQGSLQIHARLCQILLYHS